MIGLEAGELVRRLEHIRSSLEGNGDARNIKGTNDMKVNTEQGTVSGVQT